MDQAKKVLLLGGTGAMGVYLIPELLKLGYGVSVTSRSKRDSDEPGLDFIQGDAKDDAFLKKLLQKDKYDAVVDFMVYRTEEFQNRVDLLLNNTKHYVFLSSYRVYAGSEKPLIEKSPRLLDAVRDESYLKTDEYGLTKARQENILKGSKHKNWTIVRPAITYSKDRFQLGTMEANEFLHRALDGKEVIFPREMLEKKTTMSWAGDVAKMIARITSKKQAYGETYTVSTAESHTWREVIEAYKEIVGLKAKIVSLADYARVIGRQYQIKYDRMYDRVIDNRKILAAANMKQSDLMSLEDGLRLELAGFIKSPKFAQIDQRKDKLIDQLVSPNVQRASLRLKIRSKLKRVKNFIRSKQEYDGAILSLGGYYNYGGLIQRYALQTFLRSSGYNFKVFALKFMHGFGVEAGDRSNLKKFATKYLNEETFSPWLGGFYGAYIVGSDQVWRDWYGGNWSRFSIFFLRFVKNRNAKRIAYAASFGADDLAGAGINARNRNKIAALIRKFDAISVREKSAVKLVKQLKGSAMTSLDPTFLLKEEDYSKLIDASSEKDMKTPSVFSYILDSTAAKERVVASLQSAMGKNVEVFQPNSGQQLPSMERWLKGIRDSEIVVTDSFHGVALSVINKKQFIAFTNKTRGLARMTDLLEPLGLTSRIIKEEDLERIDVDEFLTPIDWTKVDKVLNKKRQESAEWLLAALGDKATTDKS